AAPRRGQWRTAAAGGPEPDRPGVLYGNTDGASLVPPRAGCHTLGRFCPLPAGPVAPAAGGLQPRAVPGPAGGTRRVAAMKTLFVACSSLCLTLAALDSLAAEALVPDISGVWMPTAIGPDGERTPIYASPMPW